MLYAVDRRWWENIGPEARRIFKGKLCSHAVVPGVDFVGSACVKNSGANAIALAAWQGAKRIILVGYDCQLTNGKTHWHGDHPKPLTNAHSINLWPDRFNKVAALLRGVEIINCSRQTALTCFTRGNLEDYL